MDGKILVEGSGNGDGATYYFIFGNREGDEAAFEVVDSAFTGGLNDEVTVTVTEVIQGSSN